MAWPSRAEQLRRLLPWFAGRAPVLDLGSGPGLLSGLLRGAGVGCVGVEYDPALVKMGRAAGHAMIRSDVGAYLTRAPAGRYGAICMSHIIEHLPPREVPAVLRRCARTLRRGGRLLILTPNPRNIGVITRTFWGDLEHTRPYAQHLLVRLVEEAGFVIERAEPDPYTVQRGVFYTPLRWVRRLLVGDYWPGADLLVIARRR